MFTWISFRWQLARLHRAKKRASRLYDADIARAYRDKQPAEKIAQVRDTKHWEMSNCEDEIAELETQYLLGKADKLGVPVPDRFLLGNQPSAGWYKSNMFERLLLNRSGRADVRAAIRAERLQRREEWLPYISAVTGLLGVVAAILAVLLKH